MIHDVRTVSLDRNRLRPDRLDDRRCPDRHAPEEDPRVTHADAAPDHVPDYAPLPANVRTGFAARASAADPDRGSIALFWLGQEGILLKGEGATLLIDPFLCQYPARLVPPADAPEAFAFVDYVLATHEHLGPPRPGRLAAARRRGRGDPLRSPPGPSSTRSPPRGSTPSG
jgi:hypothetical protein